MTDRQLGTNGARANGSAGSASDDAPPARSPVAADQIPAVRTPGVKAPGVKAATIYDVARRARVSPATVSRVMRDTAPVARATRQRVSDAMIELRFSPSRLGVSLAEGRHAANGIVFPDLAGPYFAEVVLGYEEQAGELDRSVLILSAHGRPAARRKVMDLANRVDGLVVLGRAVVDEVVADVIAGGQPVVTLARQPIDGADAINADNHTSAVALGAHLAAHGHRRFVLLGDAEESPDVAARWSGLRSGLTTTVSDAPEMQVEEVATFGFDVPSGVRAGRELLGRPDRPDVVVCANDEIALGVLEVAASLGIVVPDDLAVTGWDDVMAARWAGLTTVRQPMRELGAVAARVLDTRILGSTAGLRRELLPTELVVRTSCGRHERHDPAHHPEEDR